MKTENAVIMHEHQPEVLPITPMAMLQMAVAKGSDLEQLQKLMDLQERWEKNEARKAYVQALAEFKKNPPRIVKDKAVSFGSGKTSYKHATLDNASEQIGHALSEHGLSHRWDVNQLDGGLIKVTCILTHQQGHSENVSMQATPDTSGSKNSIQAIGSTVSYLQRYTLFAATGLAPKDAIADDDGRGGDAHSISESQKMDFINAIDGIADKDAWSSLWSKMSAATTAAGDVTTHEELKGLMAKKFKALK